MRSISAPDERGNDLRRVQGELPGLAQGKGDQLRPVPFEQPDAARGQRGRREEPPRLEAGQEKVEDLGRAVAEEDVFGRDMLRARDETSQVAGLPVRGKLRLLQRLSHRVLRLAGRPEGIGQERKVEDLAGRDAFRFGVIVDVHVLVWTALRPSVK